MQDPVIYLSGPITGVAEYWLQFERWEDALRERGFVPINPAILPGGLTPKQYMAADLAMMLNAEAVFMLPGWAESEGCKIERALAEYCGMPVFENLADLLKTVPRCFE